MRDAKRVEREMKIKNATFVARNFFIMNNLTVSTVKSIIMEQ